MVKTLFAAVDEDFGSHHVHCVSESREAIQRVVNVLGDGATVKEYNVIPDDFIPQQIEVYFTRTFLVPDSDCQAEYWSYKKWNFGILLSVPDAEYKVVGSRTLMVRGTSQEAVGKLTEKLIADYKSGTWVLANTK